MFKRCSDYIAAKLTPTSLSKQEYSESLGTTERTDVSQKPVDDTALLMISS